MGRHKTTDVDLELAMACKQKIEPIARQDDLGTEDEVDVQQFKIFADWSVMYCDAAIVDLRVQKTKQEQEALEKEMSALLSNFVGTVQTNKLADLDKLLTYDTPPDPS